jgi:hypothetical protein
VCWWTMLSASREAGSLSKPRTGSGNGSTRLSGWSQVMFMDRDDILNLFIVTNLPLPKGALPPQGFGDMDDDISF